jgi:hypothetical protein
VRPRDSSNHDVPNLPALLHYRLLSSTYNKSFLSPNTQVTHLLKKSADHALLDKILRLTCLCRHGMKTCPRCNGTGKRPGTNFDCSLCHGKKVVEDDEEDENKESTTESTSN